MLEILWYASEALHLQIVAPLGTHLTDAHQPHPVLCSFWTSIYHPVSTRSQAVAVQRLAIRVHHINVQSSPDVLFAGLLNQSPDLESDVFAILQWTAQRRVAYCKVAHPLLYTDNLLW